MNRIFRKIQDRTGSSLVMALFFLLLASMISLIMLSAANSAAGAVRGEQQRQQIFLSLSSAADFVQQGICNDSYTKTQVSYAKANSWNDAAAWNWIVANRLEGKTEKDPVTEDFSGDFAGLIRSGIDGCEANGGHYENVLYLRVDGDDKLDEVRMDFSMDYVNTGDRYRIKIVFSQAVPDDNNYFMTLSIPSLCTKNVVESTVYYLDSSTQNREVIMTETTESITFGANGFTLKKGQY